MLYIATIAIFAIGGYAPPIANLSGASTMGFLSKFPFRYTFGIVINTVPLLITAYLIFFAPDTSIESVAKIALMLTRMAENLTKQL